MRGGWTTSHVDFVAEARRQFDALGAPDFAAPQDWMCEPHVLALTGLTVAEHQRRTVESVVRLQQDAPDVRWAPVLQGWSVDDYLRCVDAYDRAGVDLWAAPAVGVGSVCRRQNTRDLASILATLAPLGLRLHGFGVKAAGLRQAGHALTTADSLAWSYEARRTAPLLGHDRPGPGRPRGHINCANCAEYALLWRERVLASLGDARPLQTSLAFLAAEEMIPLGVLA